METSKPVAIYALLDAYGVPRYVGKSVDPNDRFRHHRKKYGWAVACVVVEWTTVDLYPAREKTWIKMFRTLRFPLENKNDGGGGLVTLKPEHKDHLRRMNIGRKQSLETIEKKRRAWEQLRARGYTRSEEYRQKLRRASTGKHHSEETKAKLQQISRAQWERQRAEGYKRRLESNAKTSETIKHKWADPVHREKHVKA